MPRVAPLLAIPLALCSSFGCETANKTALRTHGTTMPSSPVGHETSSANQAETRASSQQAKSVPLASAQDSSPDAPCPVFGDAPRLGTVATPDIDEASGMAASRENSGVLWVHNDSGDSARLFALSREGRLLGVYALPSVRAVDWEDMAIGPKPGSAGSFLYIGDIGDNNSRRQDGVLIHRAPEPKVHAELGGTAPLQNLETFRLRYPDGPHDAETLLVDPKTGEVVIVTKVLFGIPQIFHAGPDLGATSLFAGGEALDYEQSGIEDGLYATGGDVSADGRFVLVRGYANAYVWQRDPAQPLHDVFKGRACRVPVASEPQGEAVAFAPDGSGYFTLSEKPSQPVYFFAKQ